MSTCLPRIGPHLNATSSSCALPPSFHTFTFSTTPLPILPLLPATSPTLISSALSTQLPLLGTHLITFCCFYSLAIHSPLYFPIRVLRFCLAPLHLSVLHLYFNFLVVVVFVLILSFLYRVHLLTPIELYLLAHGLRFFLFLGET